MNASKARDGLLVQRRGRKELVGWQAGLLQIAFVLPVSLCYRFPFRFQRRHGARQEDDGAAGREIVPQEFRLPEEKRQVVLRSLRRHAFIELAEYFGACRIFREAFPEAFPEGLDAVGVERQFARRQQPEGVQFLNAALRGCIEPPDGLDFPVDEFDPHRRRGAAGEDIQQCAPNRIFARFVHQRHAQIGGPFKPFLQIFRIDFLSAAAVDPEPPPKLRLRRQAVEQRGRGHEQRLRGLGIRQKATERFQAP